MWATDRGGSTATEEQARSQAEALALAMGITFYVVRTREGRMLAAQMPPLDSEIVATIDPPRSGQGADIGVSAPRRQGGPSYVYPQQQGRIE